MMMESLAILVLLFCGVVFCWALYRQLVETIRQFKILRRLENILLLIWEKPKYLMEFKKVDETNETLCKTMVELIEVSEEHQREKSQLSEKKKIIEVMREKHDTMESFVEKMSKFGRPA